MKSRENYVFPLFVFYFLYFFLVFVRAVYIYDISHRVNCPQVHLDDTSICLVLTQQFTRSKSLNNILGNRKSFSDYEISLFQKRAVLKIPVFSFLQFEVPPFHELKELIFIRDFQIFTQQSRDLGFPPNRIVANSNFRLFLFHQFFLFHLNHQKTSSEKILQSTNLIVQIIPSSTKSDKTLLPHQKGQKYKKIQNIILCVYNQTKMLNVWSLVLSLVMILGVSCDQILVILDNKNIHQTHSQFLAMLGEVHTVQFAYSFAKSKIELRHFDRFKYDHIILMATSEADSKSQIKINDVVNYFDEGGNVILIPDVDTSKSYRKLFYAFGVELDEYGSRIKDNFNFHANNDLIRTSQYAGRPFIMTEKPLLYRGIGLKLVNFENYQLYELITSESTAFSKNYIKDSTQRVGSLCLAAAVQGLNNARALILGSTEFFSDELFNLQQYGNKEAAIDLIAWTFQKSGVIRARDMFYHGEGAAGKETLFNVGEKIYYQVEVEIQDGYQWVAYSTNDLQVEFVMLDPWVRVGLQQQNSSSTYSASFYAPGKEGIYQFKIIYKKPGYTFLKEAERVTVRPYKHDEYERFLFVAHPYFFGLFATIFGTFIFIVVYLYSGFQTSKVKQE